jgi:hypothetical protein
LYTEENLYAHPLLTPTYSKLYIGVVLIHDLGYPWFELFGATPPDTTSGQVEAELGSWCACETVPLWSNSHAPHEDSPFSSSQRAFCTGGLDLRDPFLRSESQQGFSVDLFCGRARCWPMLGKIKPQRTQRICGPFLRKSEVLAYIGRNENLKDLNGVHASASLMGDNSSFPFEDHPLDARRTTSALEGLIREILCCDPKESRAFLWILSTEGRSAGRRVFI